MDSAKVKVHRIGFTQLSANHAHDHPYKVNIVFVHGLRGHPERTWTSGDEADSEHQSSKPKRRYISNIFKKKESESSHGTESSGGTSADPIFWPRDFLAEDLPNARVWTYGYNADIIGGLFKSNNQNSISQHGQELAAQIKLDIENREPIVFVAHSLGGILVKDALGRSEDLCLRTSSILFLGTPHRGSDAAEWGQIAANIASLVLQDSNKKILKSLEVNGEVLDNIHGRFVDVAARSKIKIYSFQEAHGISGMKGLHNKVVDDYSSKLGLPSHLETVRAIDANHREMTKCRSRNDPQYRGISGVLRHIIRDIPLGTVEPASEVASPIHEAKNVKNIEEIRRYKERCNKLLARLYGPSYEDCKNRNPKHTEGTCKWFTSHPLFQGWQEEQSSALLWVSADPGCGKSVLARCLVDEVLQPSDNGSNAVCYFFFKDDFENQRISEKAICCILHQIFTQKPSRLSEDILDMFDGKGDNIFTSLSSLWGILIKLASDTSAGGIVCVLDALDECNEEGCVQLITAIRDLYEPKVDALSLSIKFLLTSRPYVRIQRGFQTLKDRHPTIHLSGESEAEVNNISKEIDIVIANKVNVLSSQLPLNQDEQQLLKHEISRIPHRTYLWVDLVLKEIEHGVYITRNDLRMSIRTLPRTVEEVYNKILRRSRDYGLAKRFLHIVVASERPLSLKEMALALAITEDHRAFTDLEFPSETQFRVTVRELCGLFVTVVDSKIYLLHQTAKEFLVKPLASLLANPEPALEWRFSLEPAESHRILAEICIRYFLLEEFEVPLTLHKDDSDDDSDRDYYNYEGDEGEGDQKHCVFLDYSARYWIGHWRQAQLVDDAPLQDLLFQLFDPSPKRKVTWQIIWDIEKPTDFPMHFWALGWASYLGLDGIVRLLLKNGADINFDGTSSLGFKFKRSPSALFWAVWGKNETTVRFLLENGADIETKNIRGETPLFAGVVVGKDIVKILLDHGADTEVKDDMGETSLSRAARIVLNSSVVRVLLGYGAHVDTEDKKGRTPLFHAARIGHKDTIELLLKNGADIEAKDVLSQTPLFHAARSGYEDVMWLLLKNGADIEAKDALGRTSLSYEVASTISDLWSIRSLLNYGAHVDTRDNEGRTPLFYAAQRGLEEVTRLLLENGADVRARNIRGRTALWAAVEERRDTIIDLLLQNGADLEGSDESGWTLLTWAVRQGSEDIVQLLLEEGANVDATDKNGDTALWHSCTIYSRRLGQDDIVHMLLSHGASTNVEGKDGRTVLWQAVQAADARLVRLLLAEGADIEARDKDGRTPLWPAVLSRQVSMIRLLLDEGANINAGDNDGWTVLCAAMDSEVHTIFEAQKSAVIQFLRQNGAVPWIGWAPSSVTSLPLGARGQECSGVWDDSQSLPP